MSHLCSIHFERRERFMDQKLFQVVKDDNIPPKIMEMLERLDIDAQRLLADHYDENSSYYRRVQPENIAHTFGVDPVKYPLLYHYTDLNALKAIVQSRSFLIGRYTNMNDKNEKKYAYNLFKNVLHESGATSDELNVFNNDIDTPTFDYYIMSLTHNKNSQALSKYGDIAIQFKTQDIQDHLAAKITPSYFYKKLNPGDGLVYPLRVLYNHKEQLNYINTIMHAWLIAFRNRERDLPDMLQIRSEVLKALALYSQCFKNPILYQEEEIRFVVVKVITQDNTVMPDLYFHGKPKIVLPIEPNMIDTIIVSHNLEDQINDISQMLRSFGFNNTQVKLTDLPY